MSDNSTQSQTVQQNITRTTPTHRHLAWFLIELRIHNKSARETIPERTKDELLKKLLEDKEFHDAALSLWYKFGEKTRLVGLAHAFSVPSELPLAIFTSGAWALAVHSLLWEVADTLENVLRHGRVGEKTKVEITRQRSKLLAARNIVERDVFSRWPRSALVFDEKVQAEVEAWFRNRADSSALVAVPSVEQKPRLTVVDGLSESECALRLEIEQALMGAGFHSDGLMNIVNAVFKTEGANASEKLLKKAFRFRFQGETRNSDDQKELAEILGKAAGLTPEQFDAKYAEDQQKRQQRRKSDVKDRGHIQNVRFDEASDYQVDIAELEAAQQRSKRGVRRMVKNRKSRK